MALGSREAGAELWLGQAALQAPHLSWEGDVLFPALIIWGLHCTCWSRDQASPCAAELH